MPRVVGDPGQPLDHGRDAGQGPQVGLVPERLGARAQRLVDRVQLRRRQAGVATGPTGAAQRAGPTSTPPGIPGAGGLARETPKARATSAWLAPRANMWAASRRRSCSPAKSRRQDPTLTGLGANRCVVSFMASRLPVRFAAINLLREPL